MHKATYHLVQEQWGANLAGAGFLAFLAYAGSALLAGAALHYTVERPCLEFRGKIQELRSKRSALDSI